MMGWAPAKAARRMTLVWGESAGREGVGTEV
jgi:hypothetical protein